MEQYMSIDINVPKLLEWFISRRHCQKDWQKDVAKIREKINAALQDMPEHKDIANLLSGSYINYFHCLKIVTILQETEADSKNIFGRYSSKRMKDWTEIISMYQKNNVYLAEAADLLISMTKYDIPNIKKQITKQQQLENEFKKKLVDAGKSGTSLKNELSHLLKDLGIKEGSCSKAALLETAKGLSATHCLIAEKTKLLLPAVEHYTTFAKYTQPNAVIDMSLIKYIAEKGDTTSYEYIKGKEPSKVILPSIHVEEEDPDSNCDVIDWGTSDDNIEIEIIDVGSATENPVEMHDDTVASGDLALSVLDNTETRTKFTNNLLELKAFLKLRLFESDVEGGLETFAESVESVEKMLSTVIDITNILKSPTVQHQYNLTHYPRYLDEIMKQIKQKESAIERSIAVAEVSTERAKDAAAEVVALTKKVKVLTQKCLQLQDQIAEEISKKYNGREVFLIGGA